MVRHAAARVRPAKTRHHRDEGLSASASVYRHQLSPGKVEVVQRQWQKNADALTKACVPRGPRAVSLGYARPVQTQRILVNCTMPATELHACVASLLRAARHKVSPLTLLRHSLRVKWSMKAHMLTLCSVVSHRRRNERQATSQTRISQDDKRTRAVKRGIVARNLFADGMFYAIPYVTLWIGLLRVPPLWSRWGLQLGLRST